MKKVLMIEVGLVLLLVLAAIIVRAGILRDGKTTPATDPASGGDTQVMAPLTEPTEPQTQPDEAPESTQSGLTVDPNQPAVELSAANAFVYDPRSSTAKYLKGDPDAKIYPASITKLFSAYVALQYIEPDAVITAGDELELVAEDASIAYIKEGHKLTAQMLVEGMMLPSGNDAAYVLAAGAGRVIGGDANMKATDAVACFVEAMNESARDLGLKGSHFCNPDGYHEDSHYTCLRDLMQIARLVMENPVIREYTALPEDSVVYASGQTNTWKNTNLLLHADSKYYCADTVGLKTGHTDEAGYCLLSAFQTQEDYVIAGVFGCGEDTDRFADTLKLYDKVIN